MPTGEKSQKSRLGRAERLLDARDYRRVSRRGRRLTSRGFVMLVSPAREPNPAVPIQTTRIGISASRRVGNAVARNRIKRRIREWYRTHKPKIPKGKDYVFIVRKPAAVMSSAEIGQILSGLVAQISDGPGAEKSTRR
ncbi:MAG: ribonuclease P protein component [Myxococcota bacterium]|jgi:ribonuclease P protein component|nr:ribonuclease P protein component [Myxococcota bacterium]